MSQEHHLGDPQELATLYAAGALTSSEAAAFEEHLQEGCPRCERELRQLDEVIGELSSSAALVTVGGELKGKVMARIDQPRQHESLPQAAPNPQVWKQWRGDEASTDWFIRRAGEGAWEETGIAGIQVRRLFVDPARNQMTALVRMAAGTAYPRHVHDGPEECLVIEGDLWAGDVPFHKGDYQRMTPGSRHDIQSTKGGCLLLIVSSLSDEIG